MGKSKLENLTCGRNETHLRPSVLKIYIMAVMAVECCKFNDWSFNILTSATIDTAKK